MDNNNNRNSNNGKSIHFMTALRAIGDEEQTPAERMETGLGLIQFGVTHCKKAWEDYSRRERN